MGRGICGTTRSLFEDRWPGYDDGDPEVERLLNEQGIKPLKPCPLLPNLSSGNSQTAQKPSNNNNQSTDHKNGINATSSALPTIQQQPQQESESQSNIAPPIASTATSTLPPSSSSANLPQSSNMAPSSNGDAKPKSKPPVGDHNKLANKKRSKKGA